MKNSIIIHISNTKFKNLFSLKIVKHENIVLSESYQFLRLCGLRSPAANLTNGRLITIICCGGFRVYFHICPAKLFVVVVSSEMIQVQWGFHHQVEFFDWFFATQFLRSGTSIKTILSLYIKTPPPFYFWICKKMRRKMTSQRGMHKCDKLMLINALHLSYKNILKEFCWQFFLACFATLDLFYTVLEN